MKSTQSIVLTFVSVALTACFSDAPNADTVKELIEKDGMDLAKTQVHTFRPKPMSGDELANLPNAYSNIHVSDCRADQAVDSEHLCFVRMDVKTILGTMAFAEDIRVRKSEEGQWRLASK